MDTGYIQFRDCDCLTVRQEALENAVVIHLLPLLDEDELNRRIDKRTGARLDILRQEVASIGARLLEIDQELVRVRRDYRRAKIDADTFNELRSEIEADKVLQAANVSVKKSELIGAEAGSKVLLTERILWDYHAQQITVQTAV